MIYYLLNSEWVFAVIVFSCLISGSLTYLLFKLMSIILNSGEKSLNSPDFYYTGIIMGVFERVFFTTIIGLVDGAGVATAIVAWIALKTQAHYKIFSEKIEDRPRIYLALFGSLSSALLSVIGGYCWRQHFTINYIYCNILNLL